LIEYWLGDDHGGHHFLRGAEAFVWDKENEHDLASLGLTSCEQRDVVKSIIHSTVLPWYHHAFGSWYKKPLRILDPFTGLEQEMPMFYYSDRMVLYIINSASTILASMIPALCILALYFITSDLVRLGAIIGFTFLLAAVLTLIAKVEKAHCFGITAAFSAVLVVFVQNNKAAGCSC
jgi:hypothetical protein